MTGDPKVLAPLQRAYLAATNAKVLQRIQIVWDFETSGKIVNNDADADAEIRAWTPPPAEPSLEQRVEALELFAKDSTGDIVRLNERAFKLEQQAKQEEQDDPVAVPVARWNGRRLDDLCACGHSWGKHFGEHRCGECDCAQFIPEPTAPDLDPVRVEAAAKTLRRSATRWEDVPLADQKIWIRDAETAIRAYLKDGGA